MLPGNEESRRIRKPTPFPANTCSRAGLPKPQKDTVMEEAMQVPLPEPTAQMANSGDSTPEVTAGLEEMTQVLVEPTASSANPKFHIFYISIEPRSFSTRSTPITKS